jgi:hypothetical protein
MASPTSRPTFTPTLRQSTVTATPTQPLTATREPLVAHTPTPVSGLVDATATVIGPEQGILQREYLFFVIIVAILAVVLVVVIRRR